MFDALLRRDRAKGSADAVPQGPALESDSSFTIVFAGDTSLGDWYIRRTDSSLQERLDQRPMSFFDELRPLIEPKNLLIANLETVLCREPYSIFEGVKKYLGWDTPERTTRVLRDLNVDAVSLANNHTMDFGPDVLSATISELDRAGIEHFGAGKDSAAASEPRSWTLRVSGQEKRLYVLGALKYSNALKEFNFFPTATDWGVNPLAAGAIKNQLQRIRKSDPDALIVLFPHWGQNYEWASDNMRRRSREFLTAGADIVLGHGAHMMQDIATDPNGTIIFSLGNFVFNSRGRYSMMGVPPFSCITHLTFWPQGKTWAADLRLYPILSDNTLTDYTPRAANSGEASELFTTLVARSPDPTTFSHQFVLAEDDIGVHIALAQPLSPRFLPSASSSRQLNPGSGILNAQPSPTATSTRSRTGVVQDAKRRAQRVARDPDRYGEGSTQECYALALGRRGITYEEGETEIRGSIRPAIRFTTNSTPYIISAARIFVGNGDWTIRRRPDYKAAAIVRRKDIVNSTLRANGFSAPEGAVFYKDQLRDALLYHTALRDTFGDGFCLKPVNGGLGKHVYVGVKSRSRFEEAFRAVASDYGQVLVERTLMGDVHRFLWVGGQVLATRIGRPMNVTGDGRSTIAQLVTLKNQQRQSNPTLRRYPLTLDTTELEHLSRAGYTPTSVPDAGVTVFLRDKSNRHAGADIIDTTESVHPTYKAVVERAVACIPGMLVCGADVVIPDESEPAGPDNYHVIELNSGPGIVGHKFPSVGKSRDIADDIIDLLQRTQIDHGVSSP
jgi:D-alanine-D-alanine ligase-like ATP-grasp enzyme